MANGHLNEKKHWTKWGGFDCHVWISNGSYQKNIVNTEMVNWPTLWFNQQNYYGFTYMNLFKEKMTEHHSEITARSLHLPGMQCITPWRRAKTVVSPVQNDCFNMSWHGIGRDRKRLCGQAIWECCKGLRKLALQNPLFALSTQSPFPPHRTMDDTLMFICVLQSLQ